MCGGSGRTPRGVWWVMASGCAGFPCCRGVDWQYWPCANCCSGLSSRLLAHFVALGCPPHRSQQRKDDTLFVRNTLPASGICMAIPLTGFLTGTRNGRYGPLVSSVSCPRLALSLRSFCESYEMYYLAVISWGKALCGISMLGSVREGEGETSRCIAWPYMVKTLAIGRDRLVGGRDKRAFILSQQGILHHSCSSSCVVSIVQYPTGCAIRLILIYC